MIDEFIKNAAEHAETTDDATWTALKSDGHKQLVAFIFMDNGDREKHGATMKNTHEQHMLGNKNVPKC